MMSFDWMSRLVCPATGEALLLRTGDGGEAVLEAPSSRLRYPMAQGGFAVIPDPLPGDLERRRDLWNHLQYNGNVSYVTAPELNLQGDAEKFARYLRLSGTVLDVGCGPQRDRPVYARDVAAGNYVGVDPLPGVERRSFPFVQAVGEALPFADATFDHVVLAGSVDHMLDWRLGLLEATRVAAPRGAVHVKIGAHPMQEGQQGFLRRLAYFAVRGLGQARAGLQTIGVRRTISYLWRIAKLKVPPGALDYFHVYLPSETEVTARMAEIGWFVERRAETDIEVYLTYRWRPAA